jgi:hypothetical protein
MTTRLGRVAVAPVLAAACLAAGACQLKRPDVVPARMLEPTLIEPTSPSTRAAEATPIRLLETQARGHIGRHLLHRQRTGELTEDPVWRWTTAPDRYLDTALRLALASTTGLRQVDSGGARAIAVTLIEWHLDGESGTRLVGAVALEVTAPDRTVSAAVIRAEEPVSADLPGDLSVVAGRLLGRLASDSLARAVRDASP